MSHNLVRGLAGVRTFTFANRVRHLMLASFLLAIRLCAQEHMVQGGVSPGGRYSILLVRNSVRPSEDSGEPNYQACSRASDSD